MNVRPVLTLAALVVLAVPPARAETADQWIAKARSYLGSESDLLAVKSVHFVGSIEAITKVPAPEDKTKMVDQPVKLPAEIVFQKPYQQRITITKPASIDTTALDDYDGWSRSTSVANPAQWRVTLLDARQIKTLRANTWENLYFYAGIERRGGRVELGGDSTVDGVACVKLSFIHDTTIVFQRYFEKATGRLVKTVTENGAEIREEGEVVVHGVKFPRKVINKSPNGQNSTIIFDQVTVNETIPVSDFAVPNFQAN